MTDLIIAGAGPAGLTAAIYALRAGLRPVVLDPQLYGGQITSTPEVENYPAIEKISGYELAQNIYTQAVKQGADIRGEEVLSISLSGGVKTVTTDHGSYETRAVILANGAKRRKLGVPGEEGFRGRGVSYCATCDGAFFRGKDVAIVGGGNTALEDALFLSNTCRKVTLIHRKNTFQGEKIRERAVRQRSNIEILFDHETVRIDGEQTVSSVTVRDRNTAAERLIPVSAVFVAIGLAPDNLRFAGLLPLDPAGYILADEDCRTSVPGIFAAGDTRAKSVRQIITAAADGAIAAVHATDGLNVL